ncbi:MAG: hypothetical protein IJ228_03040 [Succinivibrio sp.]|nr:hypothetical protein [Succinivibrio sp.]
MVNAVAHRDYAIGGTDIQIKMFDDRLEVDSPGTLSGLVRKENIRFTPFSRNPKIAAFLKDYGYVKEFGEGVDRMCRELEALGLPDPVFDNSTFILKTTVKSKKFADQKAVVNSTKPENASIQPDITSIQPGYASIQSDNTSIQPDSKLIQRLDTLISNSMISAKSRKAAETLMSAVSPTEIIDVKKVMEILSCQTTKARAAQGNGKQWPA